MVDRVKNIIPKPHKVKVSVAHSRIPVVLGAVGGILTILIAVIIFSSWSKLNFAFIMFGIWGLFSGIAMVYASILLKREHTFRLGSRLLIILSIIAMIPGMFVGPIIGLVAGLLTHVRKMI
jgi:hypothetical protein